MLAAIWITVVILELIHASKPDFAEGLCLLDTEPTQAPPGHVVIHENSLCSMTMGFAIEQSKRPFHHASQWAI